MEEMETEKWEWPRKKTYTKVVRLKILWHSHSVLIIVAIFRWEWECYWVPNHLKIFHANLLRTSIGQIISISLLLWKFKWEGCDDNDDDGSEGTTTHTHIIRVWHLYTNAILDNAYNSFSDHHHKITMWQCKTMHPKEVHAFYTKEIVQWKNHDK